MYQRLLYSENYLFKIKFVFFLYLLLSASWKENDLPLYISDIREILGYRTSVFIHPFPWHLHITITYNLPHLRLWNADVVTVIAYTPEVVCQAFQTSRHEKDGTWSELTWFETTVLWIPWKKLCLAKQELPVILKIVVWIPTGDKSYPHQNAGTLPISARIGMYKLIF